MNNTLSKSETKQKMTYAQLANSQEVQLKCFIEYGPRKQLIVNCKLGQPVALLPRPSALSSSEASSIDDSDKDFYAHQKKKRKRVERSLFESSSSTSSSRSSRHHKTQSRRCKRRRHSASQATSPSLTSPQGWRISERNDQDCGSTWSFPVRHEQDKTERFLEEVSRVKQMAIREFMVYFGTSRNISK
ncbi:MAG: hypothetical protein EZS28_022293 [Streblomastix strix]|uniref:Uncharacterized protein n=1 Tax=Streblomastix strix TaxID=222440 RepID=A0A5J4VHY9_9EUKA|nr:MAG: hypothetical protein EZS28_022293 [Streblomastix strix]